MRLDPFPRKECSTFDNSRTTLFAMCLHLQVEKRDTFVIAFTIAVSSCIDDNFWSRYENSESFARIEAPWFRSIFETIVLRKFMARSRQRIVWIILREKI